MGKKKCDDNCQCKSPAEDESKVGDNTTNTQCCMDSISSDDLTSKLSGFVAHGECLKTIHLEKSLDNHGSLSGLEDDDAPQYSVGYGDSKARKITIEQLDYGFKVTVGCQELAITDKELLQDMLNDYLKDPHKVEQQWLSGVYFEEKRKYTKSKFVVEKKVKHVGVIAKNNLDFVNWSETYPNKCKYSTIKRFSTKTADDNDVITETIYYSLIFPTNLRGMSLDKVIETFSAKHGLHYEQIKKESEICLKRKPKPQMTDSIKISTILDKYLPAHGEGTQREQLRMNLHKEISELIK